MSRALVCGEMCIDIVIHNPDSATVLGHPVWAEDVELRLGGSASYAAQALHALGLQVALSGVVGDEPLVKGWLGELGMSGIDTTWVRRLQGQLTTRSVAVARRGEIAPICCSPFLRYGPEAPDMPLEGVKLLYFGGYLLYPELWTGLLAGLLARARDEGALVALDPQFLPIPVDLYRETALTSAILQHVDLLLVNRTEAIAFTGCSAPLEAAQALGARGPRMVVVKLGREGSIAWTSAGCARSRACRVDARDSFGAGDFYGAAFAYGLAQGWGAQYAGDFANSFAALCISRGRGKALPTVSEAIALIDSGE